jgi:hypothetical protein
MAMWGPPRWFGILIGGILLTMAAYAAAGGTQRERAVYTFPEAGYGCAEEWGPFGSRSGTISFTPPRSLEGTYTQSELIRCYPPRTNRWYILAGLGAGLSLVGVIGAGISWVRAGIRWRGAGDLLIAGAGSFATAMVLIGVPIKDALANICFLGCPPSPTDPFDVIFMGYLGVGILLTLASLILFVAAVIGVISSGKATR